MAADWPRHESSCVAIQQSLLDISESRRQCFWAHGNFDEHLDPDTRMIAVINGTTDGWPNYEYDTIEEYRDHLERLVNELLELNTLPATQLAFEYLKRIYMVPDPDRRYRHRMLLPVFVTFLRLRNDQGCFYFQYFCCSSDSENPQRPKPTQHQQQQLTSTFYGHNISVSTYQPVLRTADRLFGTFVPRKDIVDGLEMPVENYIRRGIGFPGGLVLCLTWWLQDLATLKAFNEMEWWFVNRLNYDVVQLIREELFDTGTLRARGIRNFHEAGNRKGVRKLEAVRDYCFKVVCVHNPGFWPLLLEVIDSTQASGLRAKENVKKIPKRRRFWFSRKAKVPKLPIRPSEDVKRAVGLLYPSWSSTPGAVEWVRQSLERFPDGGFLQDVGVRPNYSVRQPSPKDANLYLMFKEEEDRIDSMVV
ncbi:hypothetical protein TWF730_002935 [Orbilia blumenaviensis]|uniref:Uncharacterized protein n=1 Tax=Orbilia blumenaviensis TaxID=1796055 RepID=A0AAV9U7S0_9PEZI